MPDSTSTWPTELWYKLDNIVPEQDVTVIRVYGVAQSDTTERLSSSSGDYCYGYFVYLTIQKTLYKMHQFHSKESYS